MVAFAFYEFTIANFPVHHRHCFRSVRCWSFLLVQFSNRLLIGADSILVYLATLIHKCISTAILVAVPLLFQAALNKTTNRWVSSILLMFLIMRGPRSGVLLLAFVSLLSTRCSSLAEFYQTVAIEGTAVLVGFYITYTKKYLTANILAWIGRCLSCAFMVITRDIWSVT